LLHYTSGDSRSPSRGLELPLTPELLFHHPIDFIRALFNPESLQQILQSWGWLAYLLLFAIIFMETGLFTFFLPGDSLLFVAGFVCAASNSALNVWTLAPLLIAAAIAGNTTGYTIGHHMGPRIFTKAEASGSGRRARLVAFLFNRKHLLRAQQFYERHGGKTIIYAQFVPVLRTFAPLVAGAGSMRYFRFIGFNVIGAIFWIASMMLLGYKLGNLEIVRRNLEKAVIAVIALSVLPLMVQYWKSRRAATAVGSRDLPAS
jgi:membrane-associated protein